MQQESIPGITPAKVCTKCGRGLPPEMFSKHPRSKDGRGYRCKDCVREYLLEYRAEHRDEMNAKAREKRIADPEKIREQENRNYLAQHLSLAWRRAHEEDAERAGLKFCRTCKRALPTSDFYVNPRCRGGLTHSCKACIRSAAQRRYYKRHEEILAREAERRSRLSPEERQKRNDYCTAWYEDHKQELKEERVRLSEERTSIKRDWAPTGCLVCGFSDLRAIDAHHLDPKEKERNLSSTLSPEAFSEELEKCVPLCVNHHRILHAMWRNGHRGKDSSELIAIMREEYEASFT